MERDCYKLLFEWLVQEKRLPLILRGARQVGKTWLVRHLAREMGRKLVEINFERDPRALEWFSGNDPQRYIDEVSVALDLEIDPARCLLFLDEIQAAGEMLAKLRWFAEDMPDLPVVSAGSLLEFVLLDHAFSMPVGRVGYLYVEPMSFAEFIKAHGQDRLLKRLEAWTTHTELSPAIHDKASEWFERYSMVGGMPAAVAADTDGKDAKKVRRLQSDLMSAYRDDFAKYKGRMDSRILDQVFLAAAAMLGRKFMPSRAGSGIKHHQVARAMDLLCHSRLCTRIVHSAANGIPLGGEIKGNMSKPLLLDVGLVHALLGTPAGRTFPAWNKLAPQVRGQIMEQIIGQQLRALSADPDGAPRLYYWQQEGGRPGEIDFLIEVDTNILPIELKSGSAGAMKSLHQFMHDKKLNLAIRLDANPPSLQMISVKTTKGDPVRYQLLNLPHYLTWRIPDLAAAIDNHTGAAP
jgi:predicted AAA+ superfamily ATPase